VRFYVDPETGEPHIYGHQVTEEEVADVLRGPGEDRPGREGSRVAIGRTRARRYLQVIYVPEPEGVFVITAYELSGKPLAAYRRRRRRRGES
jgi:response regulator of citrate/malate metabolism